MVLAARAAASIQSDADPDALHTAALVDLVWGDSGKSLDQSISYLRAAARQDNSAATLADLSAALLVRAGRTQDSGDLVEAMEQADRAIALEPRSVVARYNLALALERLDLTSETDSAWTRYAAIDRSSPWANEARRRRISARTALHATPTPSSARSEIETFVAESPQAARELGWDHALDDWATAQLQHDSTKAVLRLKFATAIAIALSRQKRDPTLSDAVHAIGGAATNHRALESLAAAHQAYARGRSLYGAGNYVASSPLFAFAASHSARSPALSRWARLHLAATLVYQGRARQGEQIMREVVTATDTTREPALAARGLWMLGTTLLRAGRYERARDSFQSSQALFARAGETQNSGAVGLLMARTQFGLGDNPGGFAAMRRGLMTLHPYHGSVWVHDILIAATDAALGEGFSNAALHFENEDVATVIDAKPAIYLTEARLGRAKLLLNRGEISQASTDITAARLLIDNTPVSLARTWATADLQYDNALASYRRQPRAAIAALDSVIVFFGTVHDVARIVPFLVARANAQLARGDMARATADLDRSSLLLASEGNDTRTESYRASLLDAARPVFDRLVALQADAGRAGDALSVLERGRAFASPATVAMHGPSSRHVRAPNGAIVLEYAFIGDTLLTWTVHDTAVRMHRAALPRSLFARALGTARTALEVQTVDSNAIHALSMLYDLLLRPVQNDMGAVNSPLIIIADGEIASIPFAALFDDRSRKYLVESHPLRFAATMHDALVPRAESFTRRKQALVVGNPEFDRRAFPSLDPLPGTVREISAIEAMYRDATMLTGRTATVAAMEKALPNADIVHYAGHAIVDDAYPDRSFLVLSPGSQHKRNAGELSASRIQQLDLRRTRLVVLAACETLRPRDGRSGGLAGLSAAFIAAGVRGVLGSQWRVNDQISTTLMQDFHAAYRRTGNGAAALRTAQMQMIRSPDPALRSPSAWAGYRYAGN